MHRQGNAEMSVPTGLEAMSCSSTGFWDVLVLEPHLRRGRCLLKLGSEHVARPESLAGEGRDGRWRRGETKKVSIWCRVAASQAPPPPPMVCPPPPSLPQATPLVSANSHTVRHPRNCPPKLGLAPWPTHGTTRQGTTGAGWKDNPQHREPQGPFPFPSSSTHRR